MAGTVASGAEATWAVWASLVTFSAWQTASCSDRSDASGGAPLRAPSLRPDAGAGALACCRLSLRRARAPAPWEPRVHRACRSGGGGGSSATADGRGHGSGRHWLRWCGSRRSGLLPTLIATCTRSCSLGAACPSSMSLRRRRR